MKQLPKLLRLGIVPLFVVSSGCPHNGGHPAQEPYRMHVHAHPSGQPSRLEQTIRPAPPENGHASVEISKPPQPLAVPEIPSGPDQQPAKDPQETALSQLKTAGARIHQQGESVSITLTKSKAGDEILAWLAQVPNVQQLDLSGTGITDEGFAKLSAMPKLEFLNLADTGIGDAGLQSLSSLPALKYIVLNGTKITDKSLTLLADSPALEGVSVIETAVTEAAVAEFKKQRPDCTIIVQGAKTSSNIMPPAPAPAASESEAADTGPALLNQWEPIDPTTASVPRKLPTPAQLAEGNPRASFERAVSGNDSMTGKELPKQAIDLEDVTFLKMVSEMYLEREEWTKAVSVLRRALELDPENRRLRYQLGIALGRSGRLDDSFTEMLQVNGEATAHYNMGVILYENALQQSSEHFQKALLLDPDIAAAKTWLRFLETQGQNPLEMRSEPKIIPAAGFRAVTHQAKK